MCAASHAVPSRRTRNPAPTHLLSAATPLLSPQSFTLAPGGKAAGATLLYHQTRWSFGPARRRASPAPPPSLQPRKTSSRCPHPVPRSHHIAQRCASLPHAFAVASLLGSNWAPGDVPTSVQTCEHCLTHFHQTAIHIKRTCHFPHPPPLSSVTVQQLLSMSSSLKPGYKKAWNRHALCFLTLNDHFAVCLCRLRREKCNTFTQFFIRSRRSGWSVDLLFCLWLLAELAGECYWSRWQ